MPDVNSLLIPTDLSPCSYNALEYAIQLCALNGAKINLLHVYDPVSSFRERPSAKEKAKELAKKEAKRDLRKKLKSLKDKLESKVKNYPMISTIVKDGNPDSVILRVAKEKKVDLILLGTLGASDSVNKYMGSTAIEIYRNSECPVLIIPQTAKFNERLNIAYASKFLEADPFKIWRAQRTFKPIKSAIRFVHFYDDNEEFNSKLEELQDFFTETSPQLDISFHSLPQKDWIEDMNAFIKKERVNVLAIYKPKRNFFDSLFKKSFTKEMALHMEVPLLVFKES